MPTAAYVGTPVTHSSAMGGLVAGVLIGAVIGAAVVATGGAAAIVIAGAAATGASLGGMAGKFLGGLSTSTVGAITTGSPNVRIHTKAAAFCLSDATCSKHRGRPPKVAQGSSTVAINGRPAARTGDKGVCGFAIGQGSPRVNIGGAPAACADVASEVPWWADAGLMVLGLAGGGLLLRGAGYGAAAIASRLGGSLVGGTAGSMGGGYAGGQIFGEGSTGQSVMAFGGGMLGGGLGYGQGARFVPVRPRAQLPGPTLQPKVADTFTGGQYTNRQLATNERFFKYHGVDNRTGRQVTWFSNQRYTSEAALRQDLAIRSDWGVKLNRVSEFDVPAGTWVSEGTAAAQGAGYPGGAYQGVVTNVPRAWVLTTKPFPP